MDQIVQDILSDRVRVSGGITAMTLTGDGRLRWTDGPQRSLTLEKQVLGFVVEGNKIRIRAVVDGRDEICCGGSAGSVVRKDFVFEPLSEDSKRLWCEKLRDFIDSFGRPKRLYIFVNPFGGKKIASKIFLDDVKPLLEDANIQFTVQETTQQLHAKEIVKGLDLSKYDGIVCVSGDGILVEVVNGLLEREDWNDAIKVPLGVVPAGTGNGMIKSLLDLVGEPCKASNAILAVIRGLVADIDIESEKYRWMGSARIDFYALQRILYLRQYNGRVSFVPAPGFENHGEPSTYSEQNICNPIPSQQQPIKILQHGYQGPDVDLKNLEWRIINGPFVAVWLHNVPWGSENTMAAPDAKFSDGYLDLIIIKVCPKLALLSLLSNLNKGGHVKSPYVAYLKVKAFILEPGALTQEPNREGIIDCDGEVLARGKGTYQCDQKSLMSYDKLQITVDQGLATLFSPV
ncbi:Sphingosine kinase 1 [Citrus sinensis]|uniref:Sphingosine kinase 1 n=1 Tax=Citrus sinensis TaxID=2711 RepID=A0ACB8NGP6_CITSI|nr:Sphingosine kinase 1 [Citrus sinensis]